MAKKRKFNKTKEWVIEEYINKDRPREEVAKECGMTVAGFKSLVASFGIHKDLKNINKVPDSVFIDLVNNQKLNVKQISERIGFGDSPIYRRLKRMGLKILADPIPFEQYDSSKDADICKWYKEGKSTTEIGKMVGWSHGTIGTHLRKNGIKARTAIEAQWNYNGKVRPKEFDDYDFMYNLYIIQRKSKKDLGVIFNCDPGIFDTVLTKLGIPIRGNSEAKIGLYIGENSANWKGGITSLQARLREAFQVQLTQKAMARDHYCCQLCGSKENLQVHHIVPFKKILHDIISEHPEYTVENNKEELYKIAVTDPRFLDLNNLVTYCKECHLFEVHGYEKRIESKKDMRAQHKLPELLEYPTSGTISSRELFKFRFNDYLKESTSKWMEVGSIKNDEDIVSSI